MEFRSKIIFLSALLSSPLAFANITTIEAPIYSGGFFGSLTGYYLQPTASDSDQQYGTLVQLHTYLPDVIPDMIPNILDAFMQNITPDYHGAYEAKIGYLFRNTATDFEISYFHFQSNDTNYSPPVIFNNNVQNLYQNLIGGSFIAATGNEGQLFKKYDAAFGHKFVVDHNLMIHPFAGVEYAKINRVLNLSYFDLIPNPFITLPPSEMAAVISSNFHGFGPLLGFDFAYSIFSRINFIGTAASSLLFGKVDSYFNNVLMRLDRTDVFTTSASQDAVVPSISTSLGLNYVVPLNNRRTNIQFEGGYFLSYYFNSLNKLQNPGNEGIINNPNPNPFLRPNSSAFGMAGPYVKVTLSDTGVVVLKRLIEQASADYNTHHFLFSMTNAWLKPMPNNDDLKYAIKTSLLTGAEWPVYVEPDSHWSGAYSFGYLYDPTALDITLSYLGLSTHDAAAELATLTDLFLPLNSNGPVDTLYASVSSAVQYKLNQFDLLVGKNIQITNPFNIHGFTGLRYLDLRRYTQNLYLYAQNSFDYSVRMPNLISTFSGAGPLLGIDLGYKILPEIKMVGRIDAGLLYGILNSKLDEQAYNGNGAPAQQTHLHTDDIDTIVPVVDTKIGLAFSHQLKHFNLGVEAGFQFSEYFKAVDLVYPTLATGLEQLNSDLRIDGPYLTVTVKT
jgi:hypothetical protein